MTHWAMEYIGKPWESGASGPDAYDCWGLVRAVYRDRLGIDLPIVDVDAHSVLAVRRALDRNPERSHWEEITALEHMAAVDLGLGVKSHHVGIWLADSGVNGLLHCVEGQGVVFQSLSSLKMHGWNILSVNRRRHV